MKFNRHSQLVGKHAFLSASKYSWTNYDEDKLETVFRNMMAIQRGTELHDFAAQAIKLGIRQARSSKTLNMYINDAIGYRMEPEQILYYSDNAFGTADAISFQKNLLRIHDLKTGVTPANMKQLVIYVALFCLEYGLKPSEFQTELRIYQSDEVLVYVPDLDEIVHVIDKIVTFDRRIDAIRMENS